jgi:hypothetical protein
MSTRNWLDQVNAGREIPGQTGDMELDRQIAKNLDAD